LRFIDIAILRAVLYSAYSNDIRGRLVTVIVGAFTDEFKLLPETAEEKAAKRTKQQKLQDEESYVGKRLAQVQPQLEKLLALLLDAKQRPNEPLKDKTTGWSWLIDGASNDLNAIRKSVAYNNISALVALDVVVQLGDATKLKIQVKDEVVVEKKKEVKKVQPKGKNEEKKSKTEEKKETKTETKEEATEETKEKKN